MWIQLQYEREFDASHHLPNYDGKCRNVHGHTWVIKVGVGASGPNMDTGMVVDFGLLKEIIDQLDHKSVNSLVANPTAENIAVFFLPRFQRAVEMAGAPDAAVEFVEVWEGKGSCVRLTP